MSDHARWWAFKIRGCTHAEHHLADRLGHHHNGKTGQCDPGRTRLSLELECSKSYLTQLFLSLETKRFVDRLRDAQGKTQRSAAGDFTSNEFRLNLDRWFAYENDEIEHEQKRLLGYFRRAVESPELAQGFHSAWLEKEQTKNGERNDFKKRGVNVRANRRHPKKSVLWIAVMSESHKHHFDKIKWDVLKEIQKDTATEYFLRILHCWSKAMYDL